MQIRWRKLDKLCNECVPDCCTTKDIDLLGSRQNALSESTPSWPCVGIWQGSWRQLPRACLYCLNMLQVIAWSRPTADKMVCQCLPSITAIKSCTECCWTGRFGKALANTEPRRLTYAFPRCIVLRFLRLALLLFLASLLGWHLASTTQGQ